MNFLKILFTILFSEKIILIGSVLQFINFIEYKNLNSNNKNIFKKKKILITCLNENEAMIIKKINELINKNDNEVIDLRKYISDALLLLILRIRGSLSKIKLIIIGDYNNYIFNQFYKYSKNILLLDDGTNVFRFNKKFKLSKKNLKIFSLFDKNFFNHNNVTLNKLSYFKKKIKDQKRKKIVFILGTAIVEKNYFKYKLYIKLLKTIKQKFKNFEIFYFPHPLEYKENLYKYNFIKIIKTSLPIEIYLIKNNYLPTSIIGFNSSSFITINKMYGKKIKLLNFNIKQHPQKLQSFYNKINFYFKDKLKIKSFNINLK